MTAFRDLSPEQQKRLEEAADWRLKLTRDPSLGSSAEYLQWCSERHNTNAREAVGSAWSMVGALNNAPEILELRRQALLHLRRAGTSRWGSWKTKFNIAAAALVIGGV